MRYDHFSLLPERAFQKRAFSGMTFEGGGGGGPTSSTVTQSNIPEYARPYVESMLGATMNQLFTTKPTGQTTTPPTYDEAGNMISAGTTTPAGMEITGFKPYVPYSEDPSAYVAGFSPLQQQQQAEAAGMTTSPLYGQAAGMAGAAGQGGFGTAQTGLEYGGAGYGAGLLGQQLGTRGGGYYGRMGAGYGGAAAGMAPEAQMYGQTAADIGQMGLRAERLGRDVGREARMYGREAAGAGGQYAQQATSPQAMQAYMSPYMQNVVDVQKQQAIRDYQEQMPQLQAAAIRAGAFGGTRDAVQRSMAQRNLNQQLQNIQAQGSQQAFQQAQQAQQFGANLGLQGLAGAQQGLGTALQGGQLGLGGIGQAMAGQQAGLQGLGQAGQLYGLGMQGAGMGLQGVNAQLAGTAQGMQGAGLGLQGVGAAQAGYGLGGQQAANLANIAGAQQQADLARLNFQGQTGAQQQAQQQQIINQAIQNYATAQQYPQQQLAFMNAMLRGLPMQSMTTQSYQAPMSPFGMLAGVGGQALGSYMARTGSTPFKKGGIVDSYAGGGETEVKPVQSEIEEKVMYHPEQYSADQIKQSIQNGIISQLIGIPILQNKEKLAQQMAAAQAMNKTLPQQPINREVLAQAGQGVTAPMGAGIDQAQIPQEMFNAAGGGIVAFANNEDQPVSEDMPLTDEEIERMSGRITTPPPRFLKDRVTKEAAAAEWGNRFAPSTGPGIGERFMNWLVPPYKETPKPTPAAAPAAAPETKAPPAAAKPPAAPIAPKPSQELDLTPKETKKVEAAENKFEKALLEAWGVANSPSETDEIKAIGRSIMRGSAQLFGARRGQEGEKIAKGFEEGIGSYDKYLENLAKDKKELAKVMAEYGIGKGRITAQERETDVRREIGMAEVAARDRATQAHERGTAEQAKMREFQTAATTLDHLKEKHRKEMEFVPPYLDKEGRPTIDRSKASVPNPKYKTFDQYVKEAGLGRLFEIIGVAQQQGAARSAVGVNPADFDKKR